MTTALSRFGNLEFVAREAAEHGGMICIEWPDGNLLWNRPEVKRLARQYDLFPVTFNGCSVGLTDERGNLLSKPWKLLTNVPELRDA